MLIFEKMILGKMILKSWFLFELFYSKKKDSNKDLYDYFNTIKTTSFCYIWCRIYVNLVCEHLPEIMISLMGIYLKSRECEHISYI